MTKTMEVGVDGGAQPSWTVRLLGKNKIAGEQKRELVQTPYPFPQRAVTDSEFAEAKDRVMTAGFERDVIDYALKKINEEEAKSELSEVARNQLVQRYESDLKRIEGETDHYRRTVDLYELESAREGLFRNFYEKMMEMHTKIEQLKPQKEGQLWRKK